MLILFSTGVPAFVPFRVHFQYSLSCTEDLVRMYRSAVTFYLNFKISQRIFRKLLSVGVSCAQKTMLNANISVFQNFLQKSFVGKFWILAPLKFWSHDAPETAPEKPSFFHAGFYCTMTNCYKTMPLGV